MDSAAGSVKLGRDPDIQALMPLRGKILNCLKASNTKILQSEVIMDLMQLIGTGIEYQLSKKKPDFDIDKLQWDKIIICTDGDVDGFQIRTLVITMFYKLAPTLLEEGRIYIAETPLYEMKYEGEVFFAYDELEKNEYMRGKDASKVHIQRSKGLGENTPDMMWNTTMNPETRRLIQVKTKGVKNIEETFETLMGNDLAGRKEVIQTEGYQYLELLDI